MYPYQKSDEDARVSLCIPMYPYEKIVIKGLLTRISYTSISVRGWNAMDCVFLAMKNLLKRISSTSISVRGWNARETSPIAALPRGRPWLQAARPPMALHEPAAKALRDANHRQMNVGKSKDPPQCASVAAIHVRTIA